MREFEEWRDVEGFEGYYQVSNLGRARSLSRPIRMPHGTRHHCGRVLSPVPDRNGYPRLVLRVDGKNYTRSVHRLVCIAFNGPPNALHLEVDHIDHDRANARASNLRWVSKSQNLTDRRNPVGKGEANPNAVLTDAAVREIRNARGAVSAQALADRLRVSRWMIYSVWSGYRWGHVT